MANKGLVWLYDVVWLCFVRKNFGSPAGSGHSPTAEESKLEGIRRTWSKMTVDFDNSREDCPLLADLSEAGDPGRSLIGRSLQGRENP